MKKLLIVAMLLVATTASAVEFTCTFGDEVLSNHVGVNIGEIKFGVAATGLVESERLDGDVKFNDWLVGAYAELAVLEVSTIGLPLKAQIFVGCEYQKMIEDNDNYYTTPYVGAESEILKGISPRVEFRYNERDNIMPEWVLSVGIGIRI